MDNAQKDWHFNNTPSSQTFRIYLQRIVDVCLERIEVEGIVLLACALLIVTRVEVKGLIDRPVRNNQRITTD